VAINSDGSKALFATSVVVTPTAGPLPALAVKNVSTGAVVTTVVAQTIVGIAADPTNPNRAYVVETGQIDVVNLAVSPPAVTAISVNNFAGGPPTSVAITPDGATLYVGVSGDGFGLVQSFPVANPSNTVAWDGRTQNTGIQLDNVSDLAVAPNGSTLYVAGPGFNSAGVGESEVLALSIQPFNPKATPVWAKGLEPGTAGGIQLGTPTSITVSPDGQTVFVGGTNAPSANSAVQAFAARDGTPGANAQLPIAPNPNGGQGLASIAVSPDGQSVLALGESFGSSNDSIYELSAATLQRGGTTFVGIRLTPLAPQSIAITPAQPSLATSYSVNLAQAGQPTSFTAAPPGVGVAGISFSYSWNFGDGSPPASGQSVSHTFASARSYPVSLTVTAQSPNGSSVDSPGQTPFWRALPATVTRNVQIPVLPPPPPPCCGFTTTTNGSTTTNKPGKPGQTKANNPKLVLNPIVGPPGSIVTVTGTGFPANTPITISWSVSTGSIVVTSDPHGNLAPTPLVLLVPDVLGPRFAVASSKPPAKAAFLVVPGTAEPGGQEGIYLFRAES
jgi:hypothetical protein